VYRALIDSGPDGIVVVNQEGQIVLANSQTKKLFGFNRDELIGQSINVLMPERFRKQHIKHWGRFMGSPQLRPMGRGLELFGQRKDGAEFPVEISLSPLETEQGMLVLAAIRDVSERKHEEEALARHTADLSRSNEELVQFAYVASHDLQEPLRKIVAFGDRLSTYCGSVLDEQGRDYLYRMQSAARRMGQLIESLLELSRVATKGREFEAVDLNKVLSDVLADLEVLILQSGGRVEAGALPMVMADRSQMCQVLQNLIGNALKFRKEREAPVVRIRSQRNQHGDWEIHVTDNGIGFEEKYVDRIFRPFQRLHARDAFEGSGMGLAICNSIVARHAGQITAHGYPGIGSDFILTFPARSKSKAAKTQ
jgi:two-component system sensor kinase FixL